MLYPKNKTKKLDMALFQNPTSEYRGTPFWAWNCDLTKEMLDRQIEYFKQMGLGGFHMHARTGLSTPYLGKEYLSLIQSCVEKAEKEDMLAWLYDEDRWPSGSAGGLVTKNPKYRQRMLLFTPNKRDDDVPYTVSAETGEPHLLGVYDVELDTCGYLQRYTKVSTHTADCSAGVRWYAYAVTANPDPWYNGQTYVDTLNPEAVKKFIDITYEAYEKTVGKKFGKRVPAIFTDEPQFARKETLDFPDSQMDVRLPWTMTFADTFQRKYGVDVLEHLPELFWDLPDEKISVIRYQYHDHTAELFATAFADQCGDWCEKHGLMLTGHMMEEPTLESQTHALGEAMRSYRSFQLPGIDMLCDFTEYSTAKQAQSAVHQYGREGMLSELYGVTDWDFDFRGHKFQGDWQAALGVTVRVPHLSWVSMRGEAKRDYPASINYQSAWFQEYPYVEDHFARLNTALTRGKPIVKVAVVHPVESYWLYWGPKSTSYAVREEREKQFSELVRWLLFGGIDFDFVSESLLPEQCQKAGAPLQVGEMQYDAVLVPDCITLRQTTVEILRAFQQAGGRLIFAGSCPAYVNAVLSDGVRALFEKAITVPYRRTAILEALEPERLIEIRNTDGIMANDLLYQLRQDGEDRWLFIAHGVKYRNVDVSKCQTRVITVDGVYTPVQFNTIDGTTRTLGCMYINGKTQFSYPLYSYDSLLVRLEPGRAESISAVAGRTLTGEIDIKSHVPYVRHEPNVLLLDQAEYALDGKAYLPSEEILRLDNRCRAWLGFPPRENAIVQPWAAPKETIAHTLSLRFRVRSEAALPNIKLALEDAACATILWNGVPVAEQPDGYYVDASIQTVPLPGLQAGNNLLEITMPFGRSTNAEWCYLLGDFDVQVSGCERILLPPKRDIGFGSITTQGLPYYGGNLTYQMQVDTPACALGIHVPHYRGAVIRVKVDGRDAGVIAYDPYEVVAEGIAAGCHTIELTLYGTRFNTFGGLHNMNAAEFWAGPNFWRSDGDAWCYEYRLRDMGILSSPIIRFYE